jgi:hypothetical protein
MRLIEDLMCLKEFFWDLTSFSLVFISLVEDIGNFD